MFCRVGIQGNAKLKKWVEQFKLQFSDDGSVWETYHEKGMEKVCVIFCSLLSSTEEKYNNKINGVISQNVLLRSCLILFHLDFRLNRMKFITSVRFFLNIHYNR